MMDEWIIYEEIRSRSLVLASRDEKKRAWFDEYEAGMLAMRLRLRGADPFRNLAIMLANGLRPYKVEGGLTLPGVAAALPAPPSGEVG